jgi:glutathione S-transferase
MSAPSQPIRLHRFSLSGHSHRVEMFLSILGLPFEKVEVNLGRGEHRAPAFLALNPLGQVPVIEDRDLVLAESIAILVYLAARYDASGRWHPRAPVAAGEVQRWFGIAAGALYEGPCLARAEVVFKRERHARPHDIAKRLLGVMEAHLGGHAGAPAGQRSWLVGEGATLADVAVYTYTAHAPEGGVSLAPYPAVRAWLARVEALPGFVGMDRSPPAEPFAAA